MPIRWRLTLWYVLLLAVALAVFASVFYIGLRYLLYDALDSTLSDRAALIQRSIIIEDGELRVADTPIINPVNDEQFVRVTDASGQVVVDTSAGSAKGLANPDAMAAAMRGQGDVRWLSAGGDHLRTFSEPIVRDGVIRGALEVGMESEADDALGFAVTLIGVSAPLILLGAAGGGVWLAGRALSPIDRITRTAADIGARDLSRRITLSGPLPDDEVGRLAHTFNAMLERIEDAFGRQRQFTADAAHELRTPLALMQSQLELALAQPRDPAEDRAVLETFATDVDRLARLASGLLALARNDARGIEPVYEQMDLANLLELVAEQYAPLAAAAGVSLIVEAQPVSLMADQDLLLQVLVNLLDNALRYAPRRSQVTLGCTLNEGRVCFWVKDESAGIAPAHLPHLFEPFYRVEPDREHRRGGIGLGLSICKMIVDAHGGAIDVDSVVGAGTTMTVCVPRQPATSDIA